MFLMLIKTWFSLVAVILIVSLLVLLADFNLANPLHWFALVTLTLAITLQTIIYLERPKRNANDVAMLQKTYKEFLEQKDKLIEELQQKKDILFKTAMKKADNDIELAELKRKWEEKMNQKTP